MGPPGFLGVLAKLGRGGSRRDGQGNTGADAPPGAMAAAAAAAMASLATEGSGRGSSGGVGGVGGMLAAAQAAASLIQAGTSILDEAQALAAGMGLMGHKILDKEIYDPDRDPVWYHPTFLDAFASHTFSPDTAPRRLQPGMVAMSASLDFVACLLSKLGSRGAPFTVLHDAFQAGSTLAKALSGPASDAYMLSQLEALVGRVKAMAPGDTLVVPIGWTRPPPDKKDGGEGGIPGLAGLAMPGGAAAADAATAAAAAAAVSTAFAGAKGNGGPAAAGAQRPLQHALLLLLHKTGGRDGGYSLGVINTGEGLEYHPCCAKPPMGEVRRGRY